MTFRYRWLLNLAFVAVPMAASAQLAYDRTTFLNGFGSDSLIWTRGYRDLSSMTAPGYLSQFVDLGTIGYPNVPPVLGYDGQLSAVAPFIAGGGQHVAVGHSLGSLVARGIYIRDVSGARPRIAGIVATVSPHGGTPLADNANEAAKFFADFQRRIEAGSSAARMIFAVMSLFTAWLARMFTIWFAAASLLFFGVGTQVNPGPVRNIEDFIALTQAPALADLQTSSTTVDFLTSRFDDGSIPRANIYGTIPFRNAVLRLGKSIEDEDHDFENTVKTRNKGLSAFKACKYIGYATIVLSSKGRKCSNAASALMRLDNQWVKYVNGWDSNGKPRYVPFDGAVPNERSAYPSVNGVNYQAQVSGVNHINVYKTRAGLNRVADGMIQIGMRQLGTPPPAGGGGTGGGGCSGCPEPL